MATVSNVVNGSEQSDRISVVETVFNVLMIVVFAVIFNFFPQFVATVNISNGNATITPILARGFGFFLPALNTLWAMSLCVNIAKLVRRRWTPELRWIESCLGLLNSLLLVVMAAESPSVVIPSYRSAARGMLLLVGLATAINPVKKIMRTLVGK